MGIGVTIRDNYSRTPVPLATRADNVAYTSLVAAELAGNCWLQGDPLAVAPMADAAGIAPDIPGGLQMAKVFILLPLGQPTVIPPTSQKAEKDR